MKRKSRFPTTVHWTVTTLILVLVSVLVAFGQTESKDAGTGLTRRERGNQAMEAALARAHAQMTQMLNKQSGETDAAYQARLRLTIRGLMKLQPSPKIVPKRGNESEAAYQVRVEMAQRVSELAHNSLIAHPGEDESAYFARLTSERRSVRSQPRIPGESEAEYNVCLKADMARARTTSSPDRVDAESTRSFAYDRREIARILTELYQYRDNEDTIRQELLKLPRPKLISLQELVKSGDTGAPSEYQKQLLDLIDTILAGSVE